jgi:N-acetylneuraminic acid mutarotase
LNYKTTISSIFLLLLFLSLMFTSRSSASNLAVAKPDSWKIKAPMPTTRDNLGVVCLNGKIYAFGGERHPYNQGDITYFNNTEEYDPSTDNWTKLQPMPTPRSSFATVVYAGKIYLFGGVIAGYPGPVFMGGKTLCSLNQAYDPQTNTWETKAPLPENRAYLSANVVRDKIYLIGGLSAVSLGTGGNTSIVASTTLAYDPANDSWTTKASVPTPVFYHASAVVDDKIYVFSGNTGPLAMATFGGFIINLTLVYDMATDSWSYEAAIPIGVQNAAAAAVLSAGIEAVYIFSGFEGFMIPTALNLTQIYYPKNNSWSTGIPMPVAQFGMKAVTFNNTIYVIGGYVNNQYVPVEYQSIQETPSSSTSPSPTPTSSSLISPNPSPTIPYSPATNSSSPTQQPTTEPNPTASPTPNEETGNANLTLEIAVLVVIVVVGGLLVYFRGRNRKAC